MDYKKAKLDGVFDRECFYILQSIFTQYDYDNENLYNFLTDGNSDDKEQEGKVVEEFLDVLNERINEGVKRVAPY